MIRGAFNSDGGRATARWETRWLAGRVWLAALVCLAVWLSVGPVASALGSTGSDPEGSVGTQGYTGGSFPNPVLTFVKLNSFTAEGADKRVIIKWETATEMNAQGFNVWRAASAADTYRKITSKLIAARGGVGGAQYSFLDKNVNNGTTYYYKLEDIDNRGVSAWHGPVLATPNFAIAPNTPSTSGVPVLSSSASWKSAGDYRYRVQVSKSPAFPRGRDTVTVPADEWVSGTRLTLGDDAWAAIRDLGEGGDSVYLGIIGRDRRGNLAYAPPVQYRLPVPWYSKVVLPGSLALFLLLVGLGARQLVVILKRRGDLYRPSTAGGQQ